MGIAAFGEHSAGTILLAWWSAADLRLADVDVPRNETSFALIRKDLESEAGKRMCVSGLIIQITKQPLQGRTVYLGLLLSRPGNILSFWAVGSTGSLVERNSAKFCGIVTGTYDYQNSGGGAGHAVDIVGMFAISQNRQVAAPLVSSAPSPLSLRERLERECEVLRQADEAKGIAVDCPSIVESRLTELQHTRSIREATR